MVEVEEEFGPKTFIKQSQKNVSRRFFFCCLKTKLFLSAAREAEPQAAEVLRSNRVSTRWRCLVSELTTCRTLRMNRIQSRCSEGTWKQEDGGFGAVVEE